MTSRGRGRAGSMIGALIMGSSVVACGTAADDRNTSLRWYVEDAHAHAALVRACNDEAAGDYRIELVEAPAEPAARRTDLLQRLRTGDDIDLIGLDTAVAAEVSESGLVAEIPQALAEELTAGRTDASVAALSRDGRLVAAPWWYEPHVLVYRGSTAERAGLDLDVAVTWNELIAGASRVGGTVEVAGTLSQWVGALISGAEPDATEPGSAEPDATEPGDSSDPVVPDFGAPAASIAADIVQTYAVSDVGIGPTGEATTRFAEPGGAFLVGPFSLLRSAELARFLPELNVAAYPRSSPEATGSTPPLSGAGIAIAAATPDRSRAFAAVSCLTGADAQETMFSTTGHLPTLVDQITSEAVASAVGRVDVLAASLSAGTPEPNDPAAQLLELAVASTWLPLGSVDATTPADTAAEWRRLLDGGLA